MQGGGGGGGVRAGTRYWEGAGKPPARCTHSHTHSYHGVPSPPPCPPLPCPACMSAHSYQGMPSPPHLCPALPLTLLQDAYACQGQKCSAQSILFMHSHWEQAGLLPLLQARAASRQLSDLTIGPVLSWTTRAMMDHVQKLLAIPGGYGGQHRHDEGGGGGGGAALT